MAKTEASLDESFTLFVREVEPRLRRALAAAVGQELGREAAADALVYGWEHWDRVSAMVNPAGYLYRVGRSRARRRRRRVAFEPVSPVTMPEVEPALPAAIASLSENQRVTVFLVHGYGWTRREVAELLGISVNSVGSHLDRGLVKLRGRLGVQIDG